MFEGLPPVPSFVRWRARVVWGAFYAFVCLFFVCLGLIGLAWTDSGSRLLVEQAQSFFSKTLHVEGWQGRLGSSWRVARLLIALPDVSLEITDLSVEWQALDLLEARVSIVALGADKLKVRTKPSDTPSSLPDSLGAPLDVYVSTASISTLEMGALSDTAPSRVFQDLQLRKLRISDVHEVERFAVVSPWGRLSGKARVSAASPFALNAKAQFQGRLEDHPLSVDGTASGSLEDISVVAEVSGGKASGTLKLRATPFAGLPLREALVNVRGIDPVVFHADAPHAQLDIDANLTPGLVTGGKASDANAWTVSGPVSIRNHQSGAINEQAIPVSALDADISWQAQRLALKNISVRLPSAGKQEGQITGAGSWEPARADPVGRFDAELMISDLNPADVWRGAYSTRIDGKVGARGGSASQRFETALRSDRYRVNASGELAQGVLRLSNLALGAGAALLRGKAQMALSGERKFSAEGELSHFSPLAFVKGAPQGDLNLRFDLAGALQPAWQAAGKLTFGDSKLAGVPVRGYARLAATPGRVSGADVDLDVLGNRLVLKGNYGLATDRLSFRLDAPALSRLASGFGGQLHGEGVIAGVADQLAGDVTLVGEQLRFPSGISVHALNMKGAVKEGVNGLVDLHGELSGFRMGVEDSQEWVKRLQIGVTGSRTAHDIAVDASLLKDENLSLKASGGLSGSTWVGQLRTLTTQGPVALQLKQASSLSVGPQRVSLGEAELRGEVGVVRLNQTEWTPDHVTAKGKISGVQLGLSLDEFQRTVFRGKSLQLGGDWDISLADKPRGIVRVYRESGDFILQGDSPVALGLENLDVNLAAQDGRLVLAALANGSKIGSINAVLSTNLKGTGSKTRIDMDAPLVGVANVSVPSIAWVGPLLSQNLRTDGRLQGEFHAVGTAANPQTSGKVVGEALGIGLADQGMRLTDGQVMIGFDAAQVRLESFSFRSDNRMAPPDSRLRTVAANTLAGSLTGNGAIQLPSGKGNFVFKASKLAALQRADQWAWVSGSAEMETGWEHIDLTAQLKADGGFVGVPKGGTPELGDDVVIRGKQKPPPQRVRVNADVKFDFGDAFLLKAYGIDTYLAGQMRMQLAQGETPRATGSIKAVNGVFDAYGQKLSIDRGLVSFRGAIDDPGLNVVALRKGLSVEAGVEVTGTAQHPKIRLVSSPSVPESEKLSWILLGRASEAGSSDVGLILSAAGAAMGGNGEGIGTRIAQGFGLDEVSVGQASNSSKALQSSVVGSAYASSSTSATGSDLSEQVVSLGKRLSSRTYLGFEQNLLGTQSVVRLSYALSRYVSLIARAGTENSLDLTYAISFR